MKRIALATACMVAALSTWAVGTALAAPEFFSEGEALPAKTKVAFTSKGVASKWEMGVVMECESSTSKGDVEGQSLVKTKITFSKCNIPSITSSCQTAAKVGVITTELLQAPLTDASEEEGGSAKPVVKYESEDAEKPVMKFTCGPKKELTFIVTGAMLAEIGPVNGPESTSGFIIGREKKGEKTSGCSKQQFLFVEGLAPCIHLETGAGEMWLVTEETLTYKKPIEVRN
jgi:hypothetical protein